MWEVAIKVGLGRLHLGTSVGDWAEPAWTDGVEHTGLGGRSGLQRHVASPPVFGFFAREGATRGGSLGCLG